MAARARLQHRALAAQGDCSGRDCAGAAGQRRPLVDRGDRGVRRRCLSRHRGVAATAGCLRERGRGRLVGDFDAPTVVVKRGRSRLRRRHSGRQRRAAASAGDGVDSTGAGDAFAAGFLVGGPDARPRRGGPLRRQDGGDALWPTSSASIPRCAPRSRPGGPSSPWRRHSFRTASRSGEGAAVAAEAERRVQGRLGRAGDDRRRRRGHPGRAHRGAARAVWQLARRAQGRPARPGRLRSPGRSRRHDCGRNAGRLPRGGHRLPRHRRARRRASRLGGAARYLRRSRRARPDGGAGRRLGREVPPRRPGNRRAARDDRRARARLAHRHAARSSTRAKEARPFRPAFSPSRRRLRSPSSTGGSGVIRRFSSPGRRTRASTSSRSFRRAWPRQRGRESTVRT